MRVLSLGPEPKEQLNPGQQRSDTQRESCLVDARLPGTDLNASLRSKLQKQP